MKSKLLLLIFVSLIIVSCRLTGVKGNGNLTTDIRDIDEFRKVDVSGNFEVEINVGEEQNLRIIAEENLLKYIKTKVKRNTLYISTRENLRPQEDLIIMISVPELVAIECSGVNNIIARGIDSDEFEIDLSGAASIEIEGKAELLKIDVSGAADLSAKNFITDDVKIDVSGAANAEIYANHSVDADVSGAGFIELYGDAKDVNMDISCACSL